jgi:hypothetical protein
MAGHLVVVSHGTLQGRRASLELTSILMISILINIQMTAGNGRSRSHAVSSERF